MNGPGPRPSPEEMLERARDEEASRKRGRLKLFFGYAPGVGKTYAMLEAARERRREGLDVVIGWIETHGRKETEALAEGLERIPPRAVEYRGIRLAEFDLDAALARRPALLLMDELAHTNAPGSRHARRWQDVLELLDAGIDLYSTLNVQHLESLNDVVAQVTGVRVRETVPDSLLDQAADVELADLTPEDLLRRLGEGKVYIPAQAEKAMDSFFRKGNLIALRELALQRTADRVDAQMTRWKRDQGIGQAWPTRERILVAIGPSPQSAGLVRAACRMAARLRAPWIALTVETPAFLSLPAEDRERIRAHVALAERLGAESMAVAAEDLAEAILSVARQRNVSRIVVGKPSRPRWRERLGTPLVERLARGSGPIDVLVTSGEEGAGLPVRGAAPRAPAPPRAYLQAAATVVAATILCEIGKPFLALADQAMIYLLGVLFVASRSSRGPALAASLGSVAALDFFFVAPRFTFTVDDLRHVITFGVMLLTGVLVANLTLRVREQAQAAREREQRTAVLYMMSRSLAFRSGVADIAETVARHVEVLFETEACVLLADPGGALTPRGGTAERWLQSTRDQAVASWAFEHARPAGRSTDTLPEAEHLFLPLAGRRGPMGILAVRLAGRPELPPPSQRQLLDLFVQQAALALERALLAEEAERAQLSAETERLRNDLLSAVSHDLRTPLAAVTGAATSLLGDERRFGEAERRVLLETIRDEAERLNKVLTHLLEITRLESGGLAPKKEWCPVEEVLHAALARLESRLADRRVSLDLPEAVLQAPFDPTLIEQVLVNLLENAAKYTPPGTDIELAAWRSEGEVHVEIRDRGAGIPAGEEERIFERFFRSQGARDAGGTGLGLAFCRAAVVAHGGSIRAANRDGGGLVFRLTLPLAGAPGPEPRELPPAPEEAA